MNQNDPVIARLISWAQSREDIRALVLSSSRTNPTVPELVDALSDYDLDVIIHGDARTWYEDRAWLEELGPVLVGFGDPPTKEYGIEISGYVIIYADGTKIDFTIMPEEIFKQVVAEPTLRDGWDDGHRVLLDKDALSAGLKTPSHREFIPTPPTAEEYRDVIDRFFTEATYVAKFLWRDELIFFKHSLDQEVKADLLRRMLEWRMEIDYNWSIRLGVLGRGLKKRLSPELWNELESTYTGASIEENWAALFKTIALFRRLASEVGSHLGYTYPTDLDKRMMAYLEKIRRMEH
ncbi:aminoglycoside 6-adenylyltransferase [Dictyobacter formicarum]|uniref:Aminoglycoside 6-adenylyltransferase n=1 Tax=Dictyobacter formicarum TaxID=2778368 RepID=A0ABQ3VK91_9CHLR|nr:aminoglycoside 6-adenylyltransferase [Dictyobacter formicarum]GHO86637.1 aminoglycoside 6-adenylyltransferase [Dictyobacter formicarum]